MSHRITHRSHMHGYRVLYSRLCVFPRVSSSPCLTIASTLHIPLFLPVNPSKVPHPRYRIYLSVFVSSYTMLIYRTSCLTVVASASIQYSSIDSDDHTSARKAQQMHRMRVWVRRLPTVATSAIPQPSLSSHTPSCSNALPLAVDRHAPLGSKCGLFQDVSKHLCPSTLYRPPPTLS